MDTRRGQSEAVGSLLLVVVVVLVLATAGYVVFGVLYQSGQQASSPKLDVQATVTNDSLSLTHAGGDPVPGEDLRVLVEYDDARRTYEFDGDGAYGGDDVYGPGDTWQPTGTVPWGEGDVVRVRLVHRPTGTILYSGRFGARAGTPTAAPAPRAPTPTATPVPTPAPANAPAADAGSPLTLSGEAGSAGTLDGTGSTGPDGDPLTYQWTITDYDGLAASDVSLSNADTATPTVTVARDVTDRDHTLTVRVRVSDADGSDTDATTVTVEQYDTPPTADAGPDATISGEQGSRTSLDGTGSTDPDGGSLTYQWTITDADGLGGSVVLEDADTATPTFTVTNDVTDRDHTATVEVTVRDDEGSTATDTVAVTVAKFNRPPRADATVTAISWFGYPLVLQGYDATLDASPSSDPDGDPLTDEWEVVDRDGLPPNVLVIGDATAETTTLRLARDPPGWGSRLYTVRVRLTVTDDDGASDTTDRTILVYG